MKRQVFEFPVGMQISYEMTEHEPVYTIVLLTFLP